MSRFFIDRPKLAWVVAIFILLAGLLAIPALPVAQFPNVAPPQISISATYPGASATTVIRRASATSHTRGAIYETSIKMKKSVISASKPSE